MAKHIVVGYIDNPVGEAALDAAVEEASLRNAELIVVNASRGDAFVDENTVTKTGWKALEDKLSATGLTYRTVTPQRGHDPADQIVDTADEVDAALVVIGLRRRSPVGKLLLGSTAQRILMDAHCPVLAVRPRS